MRNIQRADVQHLLGVACVSALCLANQGSSVAAFSMGSRSGRTIHQASKSFPLSNLYAIDREKSFILTEEEVKPIVRLGEGDSEKIINAWGLWGATISALTMPFWAAAMTIVNGICALNEDLDPHRAVYDATGKVWSKLWLIVANSYPEVTGDVDRLKTTRGPCIYVANHASWLDIPILCTVLDPVFKFISKAELVQAPCIGQQLTGGNHILIDREDRKSQLRTFKEGVNWLKKGVPLMAFPEGARSKDGRLMPFKGGVFSMAMRSKVPIVPISIMNTHAVMPSNALFPVQCGKGKLGVHVHPAIDTVGKTEQELVELVRAALLSKLPKDQHPLEEPLTPTAIDDLPKIKISSSQKHKHQNAAQKHGHAVNDVTHVIKDIHIAKDAANAMKDISKDHVQGPFSVIQKEDKREESKSI
uniref:Phospholipid/glycerol acyltransferase domain-containing protein n=1 Tax=Attheya septentrionalis TaxID=420275 RepID=A0A7S2URA0_9STRA|mmetsp:Transcript_7492/g.13486  ORF Transcript_7492/g.13486 Transcript_7492/m.13486 type:complete len:417 (+) Transcript_7492:199-1449(+)